MWTRMYDFDRMLNSMDLFRTRFDSVLSEFDRLARKENTWQRLEGFPKTNMHDTGENLHIAAEMPGVQKEDVQVKIQGNYLEIRGKRKVAVPEGYTTHRSERGDSSFSRSFTLPYDVDAENVTANLKDGLLSLTLPKSEAAKPKQIAIH